MSKQIEALAKCIEDHIDANLKDLRDNIMCGEVSSISEIAYKKTIDLLIEMEWGDFKSGTVTVVGKASVESTEDVAKEWLKQMKEK